MANYLCYKLFRNYLLAALYYREIRRDVEQDTIVGRSERPEAGEDIRSQAATITEDLHCDRPMANVRW